MSSDTVPVTTTTPIAPAEQPIAPAVPTCLADLKRAYKNHNVIDPDILLECLSHLFGVKE